MTRTQRHRGRLLRAAVVTIIIAIGVPIALSQLGDQTGARFGASDDLGPNQLVAATLSIGPGEGSIDLRLAAMQPGDDAVGRLDLVNDGSLPLRYAIELDVVQEDDPLAGDLTIELWTALTCSTPDSPSAQRLTGVRSFEAPGRLVGNPALGPHPGDRELAVGATDTICYRVSLPLDATNGSQARTVRQSFVVTAEHVVPERALPDGSSGR